MEILFSLPLIVNLFIKNIFLFYYIGQVEFKLGSSIFYFLPVYPNNFFVLSWFACPLLHRR